MRSSATSDTTPPGRRWPSAVVAALVGLTCGGLAAGAAQSRADPPTNQCYWATAGCAYDLITNGGVKNSGAYSGYGNRMRSASAATNKAVWHGNSQDGKFQVVQDLNWNYPSGLWYDKHYCKNNQTGGVIAYCGWKNGT